MVLAEQYKINEKNHDVKRFSKGGNLSDSD